MKNYKVLFLFVVLFSVLLACEDDPEDPIDSRDVLIGTWDCTCYDAEFLEQRFSSTISKALEPDRILISNFHNFKGDDIYAVLDGQNLTIPEQTTGDWTVEGSGTISDNNKIIDWTYTINEGNGDINAEATYNSGSIAIEKQNNGTAK